MREAKVKHSTSFNWCEALIQKSVLEYLSRLNIRLVMTLYEVESYNQEKELFTNS